MRYYKDAENNVYAYESDGSQDKFIPSGLTPITEEEKEELLKPLPKTHEELVLEVSNRRKASYTDALTGSDPLFAEAYRMSQMGEPDWEIVRDKAIARYLEIKEANPWPEA